MPGPITNMWTGKYTSKAGKENYVDFSSKGQSEFTVTIKTLKEM